MRHSFSNNPTNSSHQGFTLIEILVVIAIIALLAAILFPVFVLARENARRSSCQSNMKQVGLGIAQYSQDYDERFPQAGVGVPTGWLQYQYMVQPYIKSIQVFQCTSNTSKIKAYGPDQTILSHYAANYNNNNDKYFYQDKTSEGAFNNTYNAGFLLSEFTSPATTISVYEATDLGRNVSAPSLPAEGIFAGHLQTSNYLFVDGHVKALRPQATIANGICMWYRTNQTVAPHTYITAGLNTATTKYD